MKSLLDLEKCQAFINCHLRPVGGTAAAFPRPAVTISRQAGCGAVVVATKLAEYLQAQKANKGAPWAVFDRNLVEQVLADHNLPRRLAHFMPEDRVSVLADAIEELCGLHPPTWILVRQTAETILHLAQLGGVILIGRGANVITSRLKNVLHIRLVGSVAKRVAHVCTLDALDEEAARRFVVNEDRARKRYLRRYFHKDINDPLLYHLTINTDLVSYDECARLIGSTVMNRKLEAD